MGGEKKQHQQQYSAPPQPPPPPPPEYGTFQGQGFPPYPDVPPVMGYPQPVPPPGTISSSSAVPPYHTHGYQSIHATIELHPVRIPRLPCCGIGLGWFLFIIGFFLAAIPWYIGAFLLFCSVVDGREKPGYVACTIAAALSLVAVIIGASADT